MLGTGIRKLFRTSAPSSNGPEPKFIWLAKITGVKNVDQISKAPDFICIEKCHFLSRSVSLALKQTRPFAAICHKVSISVASRSRLPPLPPEINVGMLDRGRGSTADSEGLTAPSNIDFWGGGGRSDFEVFLNK